MLIPVSVLFLRYFSNIILLDTIAARGWCCAVLIPLHQLKQDFGTCDASHEFQRTHHGIACSFGNTSMAKTQKDNRDVSSYTPPSNHLGMTRLLLVLALSSYASLVKHFLSPATQ